MIEFTTGVVFLLSSMYGGASTENQTATVAPQANTENKPVIEEQMNRKDIENYLREHYSDTPILIEIARCESTFVHYGKDGEVIRGLVNNKDVGVMQINEKYHLEAAMKLGYDIHTIEGNVAYAKYLYSKYGASPWSASKPCWGSKIVAMK